MAFHTIWSVDLGKSALKAVKLRRDRNNVEILAIDKVDYPLSANGVDSAAQAREALNVFRTRNEVRDPVVVAHPGQGTFSRFIKVPAFDQKKVREMVRYEASQQIPFPLDEVIWDYHLVNREYLPGEEREIGLFAVRRETIDDYLLDFNKEGLSVEMLSIGYLGLLNFIKYDINPKEPSIILDIGAAHTDLILMDGERFWIRPLAQSGNDISKAIMTRFKLDFVEAEKLKIDATKSKQAAKIFQTVIQPKLQELAQEVQRSIGFYRSQAGEVKFTCLYLLGNGSKIVGIKKFFEEYLGIPVERILSISRLRVSRDVNIKLLQLELPAFGTALGCAIQAVGVGPCQVDLVPREEKLKKEVSRKKKHVFIAAGILCAAIVVAFLMIRSKTGEVDAILTSAQSQLKETQRYESNEKKRASEDFSGKIETLKQLAETRQSTLEGLRALERVMAGLPKVEMVDVIVREDDTESAKAAVDQGEEKLKDRLWIPYLNILKTQFPEGAPAGRGTGKAKAAAVAAAGSTVPAYKFTAFTVIKQRETLTDSAEAIRKMLEAPLKKELTVRELTKRPEVKVSGGRPNLPAVIFVPDSRGGSTTGAGQEGLQQQGGPFFGTDVTWYMLTRHPAAAEKAPPEKAATAEKEEAADTPEKPEKGPTKKRQPK